MNRLIAKLHAFKLHRETEKGATAVEYGLMVALIAVASVCLRFALAAHDFDDFVFPHPFRWAMAGSLLLVAMATLINRSFAWAVALLGSTVLACGSVLKTLFFGG